MSGGVRFDSVADLPAWAQKQLVKKMTAEPQKSYLQDLKGTDPSTPLRSAQDDGGGVLRSQQDDRAGEGRARNKYGARKTEVNGITFDSRKEARRFQELLVLLKSGQIRELKLQHDFTLQEAYTTTEGVRVRAIRFRADFSYEEPDGKGGWRGIVEDVKSKATKTKVYAIKKKMMLKNLGLSVREYE